MRTNFDRRVVRRLHCCWCTRTGRWIGSDFRAMKRRKAAKTEHWRHWWQASVQVFPALSDHKQNKDIESICSSPAWSWQSDSKFVCEFVCWIDFLPVETGLDWCPPAYIGQDPPCPSTFCTSNRCNSRGNIVPAIRPIASRQTIVVPICARGGEKEDDRMRQHDKSEIVVIIQTYRSENSFFGRRFAQPAFTSNLHRNVDNTRPVCRNQI